jgi:hypothetical protein
MGGNLPGIITFYYYYYYYQHAKMRREKWLREKASREKRIKTAKR